MRSGEVHVASGEVHVASGEVRVASGEVHVASGEVHVASGEVHVASGEVHVASGEVHVASGEVRVACGEVHVTSGEVHVTSGEMQHVRPGKPCAGEETPTLAGPMGRLSPAGLPSGVREQGARGPIGRRRTYLRREEEEAPVGRGTRRERRGGRACPAGGGARKAFGGSGQQYASAVAVDGAGNVVIASPNAGANGALFAAKLDGTDGSTLWSTSANSEMMTTVTALVAVDPVGDISLAGAVSGPLSFPGVQLPAPSPGNATDLYLVALSQ